METLTAIPDGLENFIRNAKSKYGESFEKVAIECYPSETISIFDDIPAGYTIQCVAQEGGEDKGSNYFTVIKFSNGIKQVFVKFYGWYSSYSGCDYEGFRHVMPQEVTKTEYI